MEVKPFEAEFTFELQVDPIEFDCGHDFLLTAGETVLISMSNFGGGRFGSGEIALGQVIPGVDHGLKLRYDLNRSRKWQCAFYFKPEDGELPLIVTEPEDSFEVCMETAQQAVMRAMRELCRLLSEFESTGVLSVYSTTTQESMIIFEDGYRFNTLSEVL